MFLPNPVVKVYQNPHPEGWGYTDKARLRGLKATTYFEQPDLLLLFSLRRQASSV
ncbi:hypothetical protein [Oscillatoria acuminata]|uniref:Uncharacterized protein n=1 Tax=Oscillatoria acuminata PCC 6304 TaxID=56110 RepID=K9TMC4_9CYAN|nr:hypothetical protein [Oscillatoria acuminata]AFY83695.1 hypothetical protein Oscil6304_4166 [Oscillatoria acuminata PCC 6304]